VLAIARDVLAIPVGILALHLHVDLILPALLQRLLLRKEDRFDADRPDRASTTSLLIVSGTKCTLHALVFTQRSDKVVAR